MPRSKDADGGAATIRRQRFCSPTALRSHIERDGEAPITTTRHRLRLLPEPAREVARGAAEGEADGELQELIRALQQRQTANAHVETDNELPPAA